MRFSLVAACSAWVLAPAPQPALPQHTVAVPQGPPPAVQFVPVEQTSSASTGATWPSALWFVGGVSVAALARPVAAAAAKARRGEGAKAAIRRRAAIRAAVANQVHEERMAADRNRLAIQPVGSRAGTVSMTFMGEDIKGTWSKQYMDAWKNDYPFLAKYGFGLTVKCERWNGRHAMFGWAFIIATALCKKYGVFPDAATPLAYKDWGALTQMGFGQYISNERAIIMIANVHALGVSAMAAFGPQIMGDTLTLVDGEEDEEPYGMIIPIRGNYGLTPAAEMVNGRLAMLGLVVLVFSSFASGKDIIQIVDAGLGGLLDAKEYPPAKLIKAGLKAQGF